MKKRLPTIILIFVLIAGVSLLLYPSFSNWWNSKRQSYAIADYIDAVGHMSKEDCENIMNEAHEFNEYLLTVPNRYVLSSSDRFRYNSTLNINPAGTMGFVEIPSIGVSLPIYHGTDKYILQNGAGHLEGSSLPVGGPTTHCVITGHRGLPSAKLFTELDKLTEGDVFLLHIIDQTLTYEVDKISIIEPQDLTPFKIYEDKDYCTLVTCTPYGINTHRLLVRGHRIETESELIITSDALQIEPTMIAPIVAAPMLLVLFIIMMVRTGKKKNKGDKKVTEKENKPTKKKKPLFIKKNLKGNKNNNE